MGSSSDGCKLNGENDGEDVSICEEISKIVKNSDSSAVPVVDVVKESSVADGVFSSCDFKYSDEIDDLLEEQMVLNKIRKMQNYRRTLAHYKDPELDKIDHRIVPKLKGNNENKDYTIASRFADEDDDDEANDNDDNDSLLDCFMASDTRQFLERHGYRENLQKVSKALTLNVLMQSELTTLGSFLMNRLKENQKEQFVAKAKIHKNKRTEKANSKKPPKTVCWFTLFGRPYFKDEQKFTCPKNPDCKIMNLNNQIISINLFPSRAWKVKEKLRLEEGIRKILVKESSRTFYEDEKELKHQLTIDSGCSAEKSKEIKRQLQCVNNQIECVKKKSLKELFSTCEPSREFDWLKVAAEDVRRHTPEECQRMWHLYVKPTINKKSFNEHEDKLMIQLIEKYGEQNWETIAARLKTSRTAFLCFLNYQKRMSKGCNRFGKWKEEEDQRLINIIQEYKVGDFIPWPKIAYYFEGRSYPQLYCRWSNSLNPNLKKGRFTKVEDKLIIEYVRKYGENFKKISKILGYRTSTQVRERYIRKKMAADKNIGRWSFEEDKTLMALVTIHGPSSWSKISKQFMTRTRTQIRQRHSVIQNFLAKHPNLGIKDIDRGPKAKQQFVIPVSVAEVEAASQVQENKLLSELIKESKIKKQLLKIHDKSIMHMKRGRRTISKRSKLDLKLIGYFKEVFSNNKLKLHTHCVKPNSERAVNALMVLCRYLKTCLILTGDEFDKSVKKLPFTLRKIVLEMAKDESGCKSFEANIVDSITKPEKNPLFCDPFENDDTSLIDCIPIDPKETIVSDTYYLLSEPSEETELYECKIVGGKFKNPNFISYFLPPNMITMIGCRSIMLIKGKIVNSLAHGISKRNKYFFPNDSELMKKNSLKLFDGYFSEDESLPEVNDERINDANNLDALDVKKPSLPCIDLETSIPSSSSCNRNTSVISLPSTSSTSCLSSVPSVDLNPSMPSCSVNNRNGTTISLPSTSNASAPPDITLPSTSLSPETLSDKSLETDKNESITYLKEEKVCLESVRLTKQEAIDLWKERLMAIFGWPIILANQPPEYFKSKKEDEEKENSEVEESTGSKFKILEESYSQLCSSTLTDVKNRYNRERQLSNNIALYENNIRNIDCKRVEDDSITTKKETSYNAVTKQMLGKNVKGLEKHDKNRKTSCNKESKNSKLPKHISEENKLPQTSNNPGTGNSAIEENKPAAVKRLRKPNKLLEDYQTY